jgi:hypothetical protein
MVDLEKTLIDELGKHFSLKTDLRQYEDLWVKLPTGEASYLTRFFLILFRVTN